MVHSFRLVLLSRSLQMSLIYFPLGLVLSRWSLKARMKRTSSYRVIFCGTLGRRSKTGLFSF